MMAETLEQRDRIRIATSSVLVILTMYAVITRLWACEDAYITFRYIDNFLNGLGLVYNAGERVEGFTHPFWLFLVTIVTALGVPVRASALWLSLLCTLLTALAIAFVDRRVDGRRVAIPLALLLFATHSGWRDFSASGLEFPLVALLLSLLYLSYKQHDLLGKPALHGVLLALTYLTRPELMLLLLSFYLIEIIRAARMLSQKQWDIFRRWGRKMTRLTLPILFLAGGYHIFRAVYFGEFFPNTYYAKIGLGTYWSQGIKYFLHFWHYSPVILGALALFVLLLIFNRGYRRALLENARRPIMLGQAALLALYVVRLGGDFMAFRFLLPPLVILGISLSDMLDYVTDRSRLRGVVSAAAIVVTAVFILLPGSTPLREGYIADERQYYDLYDPAYKALFREPTEHYWYARGMQAKEFQERTGYPIVIGTGNIGYLGYAAGPNVRIVDVYGLVDRAVARNHQVLTQRSRPGHEIKLRLGMALEKNVTFWETPSDEWNQMMATDFGVIITLDPALLKHFPDQLIALKALKFRLKAAGRQSEPVFELIKYLESKHGVRVEDLDAW